MTRKINSIMVKKEIMDYNYLKLKLNKINGKIWKNI